ncbi:MAG: hypothetical protein ACI9MR_004103, partial [Myxococcota bacterium]
FKTGAGNTWNRVRIQDTRQRQKLPAFAAGSQPLTLTKDQAAHQLGISQTFIKRLLKDGILTGRQIVKGAPWKILPSDLTTVAVTHAVTNRRRRGPRPQPQEQQLSLISNT